MKILIGLAEGQVLQRNASRGATARIGGTSSANGPVFATIKGPKGPLSGWKRRRIGDAARGKFTAILPSLPAGGPYRLALTVGETRTQTASARIGEFFVGDVWLLAGQSNMQGVGNMTGAAKPHPLIRAFSMRREWRLATDPLHILDESPDLCHNNGVQLTPAQAAAARRNAVRGVGVGIFFAREMLKRTGVPQGLVCASHGGTNMTQWDPLKKHEGGASLYGSLLLSWRATGQKVAGLLWFQGESDANPTDTAPYTDRMKKLVAATRRDLGQLRLPWVIVQISRAYGPNWRDNGWSNIQEQQRLLPDKIAALETVVSIDLPMDDGIHIGAAGFPLLGARLAQAADRLVNHRRGERPAPRFRTILPALAEADTSRTILDIAFDHVPGGLHAAGEPQGFALVDNEGRVIPSIYKITLRGSIARLHFDNRLQPDARSIVYGPGLVPICNIMDGRGHALPAFGPIPLSKPSAWLPFVVIWRKTDVIANPVAPLGQLACPDLNAHESTIATYGTDGFINEHPQWIGRDGHAYFSAKLDLPETMKLEVMMGYDGPFRLWIDDKAAFANLNGINPCFPDESAKITRLSPGIHTVTVAMETKRGMSWGFFLRFRRRDVTPAQIKRGDYLRPVYSV